MAINIGKSERRSSAHVHRACRLCDDFRFSIFAPHASALETSAREAVLVDYDTGAIPLQKDADKAMPPASMTKDHDDLHGLRAP